MGNKAAARIALVCGLLLGVAASYVRPSEAARNSSGTYSLPSGNPVTSGTTITSSWANTTLSDIGTELTDSLSRSGKGAMTAALELANGTVAAPALSFDSDVDTGLYRSAANTLGIATGGAAAVVISSSEATFSASITGEQGIDVTNSNAGGPGIVATGNTTGNGGTFTGGGSSGAGVSATGGASNGHGVVGTGDGTGEGGVFTGGDSNGDGISATGGATNGHGGVFVGTGTGNAIRAGAGHIALTGSDPASNTGFSDTLTPMNIPKAWAKVHGNGGGAATVVVGFNVTNPVENGNNIELDFVTDFSVASTCVVTAETGSFRAWASNASAATVNIGAVDDTGAAVNLTTISTPLNIVCFGAN